MKGDLHGARHGSKVAVRLGCSRQGRSNRDIRGDCGNGDSGCCRIYDSQYMDAFNCMTRLQHTRSSLAKTEPVPRNKAVWQDDRISDLARSSKRQGGDQCTNVGQSRENGANRIEKWLPGQ